MSAALPVLEMRGIRKTFPGVVALDGVDLEFRAGEVHILQAHPDVVARLRKVAADHLASFQPPPSRLEARIGGPPTP